MSIADVLLNAQDESPASPLAAKRVERHLRYKAEDKMKDGTSY
jgi:hypothetical protein